MQRLKIVATESFLQKPDGTLKLDIPHIKPVKQNNYVVNYILNI